MLTITALFREEHRRRKKSCPFFSASAPALTNRTGSQSQPTKPPSKSKPPTRSTSKSKHQDFLLPTKTHDGDDNDSDSPPVKVRSRSKSVTRSEPEESNAEGEIQKKSLRSRSKTKGKDSEDVPRKSSRPKAKASKGHSRTRSKTKVFESEPEEEPLATIKPRSTSQPEPQREVQIPTVSPIREIDPVGDIEPQPQPKTNNHVYPAPSTSQRSLPRTPPKVITSLSKAVPSTTVELEPEPLEESESEVAPIASKEAPASPHPVMENYLPPLSSPSPERQKMDVVDISSDEESGQVIEPGKFKSIAQSGKENTHGSTIAQVSSQPELQPEVRIVFSQSKKSKRSLTVEVVQPNNPPPSVPTVSPIRETDIVSHIEPEPETNNHVYSAPSTSQRSLLQTPPKVIPVLSKLLVEPNNRVPSVPTVSPIREIDGVRDFEPEPESNNHVFPASTTPQRSLPQTPPPKVIPALSKLVVQPNNPLPSVPAVSPIREVDEVGDVVLETQPETNNHVDTIPSTPQGSLPQTPPKKVITTTPPKALPLTTVELIPALSKLPCIPLHTLTEAELDMTVEEWIRYQIDVEYDKFRRDGERELQRFRSQAEEVRKAIEGS